MVIARTILAALIALSVSFAPIASGAAPAPAPAEISMTDGGDHDCCPNAMPQPCDMMTDGCMSMAACAALTFLSVPSEQVFVLPHFAAAPVIPPFSEVVPSRSSGPPLRPPQA